MQFNTNTPKFHTFAVSYYANNKADLLEWAQQNNNTLLKQMAIETIAVATKGGVPK